MVESYHIMEKQLPQSSNVTFVLRSDVLFGNYTDCFCSHATSFILSTEYWRIRVKYFLQTFSMITEGSRVYLQKYWLKKKKKVCQGMVQARPKHSTETLVQWRNRVYLAMKQTSNNWKCSIGGANMKQKTTQEVSGDTQETSLMAVNTRGHLGGQQGNLIRTHRKAQSAQSNAGTSWQRSVTF